MDFCRLSYNLFVRKYFLYDKIIPKIIPPKFEKNVRKYFRRSLSAQIFGC